MFSKTELSLKTQHSCRELLRQQSEASICSMHQNCAYGCKKTPVFCCPLCMELIVYCLVLGGRSSAQSLVSICTTCNLWLTSIRRCSLHPLLYYWWPFHIVSNISDNVAGPYPYLSKNDIIYFLVFIFDFDPFLYFCDLYFDLIQKDSIPRCFCILERR